MFNQVFTGNEILMLRKKQAQEKLNNQHATSTTRNNKNGKKKRSNENDNSLFDETLDFACSSKRHKKGKKCPEKKVTKCDFCDSYQLCDYCYKHNTEEFFLHQADCEKNHCNSSKRKRTLKPLLNL